MENDNTVFQNPNLNNQPKQPDSLPESLLFNTQNVQQQSQAPNLSQVFTNNPPPPLAVASPLQSSFNEKPKKNKISGIKKFLSLLVSILIVLGVIVMLASLIIPGVSRNSGLNQTKIIYWGLFEESSVMQVIISDFERQNPNIKIEYIKQDINQYKDRLVTRALAGTGPDIFRFHNTWYPMLSALLLPLPSNVVSLDEFKTLYYPVAQKDLIKNGAIYGIPLQIDTLSLFINNQLFQSAGLTPPSNWNDFINVARAMTVKEVGGKIKTAGAAIGTFDNISHAPDIMSLLFLENGVDFNNLNASSDRISGALTFYTSFAQGDSAVWDNTLDPSLLGFSKGNVGMFFGYSSDYFAIKKYNPSLSFQIVPVPQLPNQNVTLASYWAEGVSLKSKHQKEALLFLKFLSKKDTLLKLYQEESKIRDFGEPFARVDLAENLKTNPLIYTFVLQAPNAASSYFVDGTYDNGLNQQLNTFLQTMVNSAANNSSIDASVESFIQSAGPVIQKPE